MTMASAPVARVATPMTYECFVGTFSAGEHCEWVRGEVVPMSPVTEQHTLLVQLLSAILRVHVESNGLGQVLAEPFQMKTGRDLPGRSPDVAFVAARSLDRVRPTFLDGPADLVIEVTSEGSRTVDRGEKYYEYETGGVAEYWIVDPERARAEFYVLGPDGRYDASAPGSDGVYRSSAVPGFWIRTMWLRDRPTIMFVLREWGLVGA